PSSATHLCPAVPPICAHPPVPSTVLPVSAASQCPAVMSVPPISAVYQYPLSVSPISATNQCRISVPPICDTSLVLPISAAYPCHLISAAYQCRPSVPPISAHQCCLINAHQ
ncbi:unnamed protein product, partial [Staurois parvus]